MVVCTYHTLFETLIEGLSSLLLPACLSHDDDEHGEESRVLSRNWAIWVFVAISSPNLQIYEVFLCWSCLEGVGGMRVIRVIRVIIVSRGTSRKAIAYSNHSLTF